VSRNLDEHVAERKAGRRMSGQFRERKNNELNEQRYQSLVTFQLYNHQYYSRSKRI